MGPNTSPEVPNAATPDPASRELQTRRTPPHLSAPLRALPELESQRRRPGASPAANTPEDLLSPRAAVLAPAQEELGSLQRPARPPGCPSAETAHPARRLRGRCRGSAGTPGPFGGVRLRGRRGAMQDAVHPTTAAKDYSNFCHKRVILNKNRFASCQIRSFKAGNSTRWPSAKKKST